MAEHAYCETSDHLYNKERLFRQNGKPINTVECTKNLVQRLTSEWISVV